MKKKLTNGQLSLWVGQKLHGACPLHNTAYTFDIAGALNETNFKSAFSELVNSCDAFRIIFGEEDGTPYQTILPKINDELEFIDFTSNQEPTNLNDWITNRSQHLFDLSVRAYDSVLLKISEKRYIWFLNMHHLITDAISFVIIQKRMDFLYQKVNEDVSEEVATWPQFADVIDKDISESETKSQQEASTYWKNKLKPVGNYPILYGKPNKGNSTEAKRISLKLGRVKSEKLRRLAQEPFIRSWTPHLSIFNIISSLLFIYLNRVGNQKRIAIGAPFQGRSTKNSRETVGYFIKIFPLLLNIEEEDTFESVVKRNKLEINEYILNTQAAKVTTEVSKSFNVVFNYIHADFADFNGYKTKVDWVHANHIDGNHQMRCHLLDFNATGELEILFDLNSDVFGDALIKEIPKHFLRLLDALLLDIKQPIAKPSLLSIEESIASAPAQNENTESHNSIERFQKSALQYVAEIALVDKNDSYSYGKLNEKANKLARFLKQQGLKKGSKIGIHLHRSPDYIIGVLATWKIGSTFVPIPSDYPNQRIEYIISDSSPSYVLTSRALEKNLNEISTPILVLEENQNEITKMEATNLSLSIDEENLAYVLYTSGSTGKPKGVLISHSALANYLSWGAEYYETDEKFIFPLFTSIGFDLTMTSIFLPLLTGGQVHIYKENDHAHDISLIKVLEDNKVNSIKLTPSHLALIQDKDYTTSSIKTIIVGGENFKTKLALEVQKSFGPQLRIFNEYGPTEATIGCIAAKFNSALHVGATVPIGLPIWKTQAYILDDFGNRVPSGVTGNLFIGGAGLSNGYLNRPDLNTKKFVPFPFDTTVTVYQTGDLARTNDDGDFEYLGRSDDQIKLRGFRIELADIETNLMAYETIQNSAVVLVEGEGSKPQNEITNCVQCGLPSNFPNADFNADGVCHLCTAFEGYKDKAQRYFKTKEELKTTLLSKRGMSPNYDCISLLSGGKDSTYILAQLVDMGLNVLAFTLDNGYISEQAKSNIDKIVSKLGVDHMYGKTEHMNAIFVDSLQRHHNVCDGCFKTIYTLSTQIALEKEIPFIVTGLSRGQFFETRLTEELFWDENADVSTIDRTILEARKLYHQEEDGVKKHLDVSMFDYEDTFQKVQFLDFYRYSDVSLAEMLTFLKEKVDWVRPTDTGRSTNCLINQVGIYIHKKERGYSNYSFPYSWDVRMGHKTREETLEEINEVIDEKEVKKIMGEIGYQESSVSELDQKHLVAYYTGKERIPSKELSNHLKKALPAYMVPTHFKYIDDLPLTRNGKVDKIALKTLNTSQLDMETPYVAPSGEIEELLAYIWKEVLRLKQVGSKDDFIALGGHSLAAIRVTARINEEVQIKFPLDKVFEFPTIEQYAKYIERTLVGLIND